MNLIINNFSKLIFSLVVIAFTTIEALGNNDSLYRRSFHTEPLYHDLVSDLGVKKGKSEFNLFTEFKLKPNFQASTHNLAYEFSAMNLLGIEIETGISTINKKKNNKENSEYESNFLSISAQKTIYTSAKSSMSVAFGYSQTLEYEFSKRLDYSQPLLITIYNPFLVIAKRWENNFHSLVHVSPLLVDEIPRNRMHTNLIISTSAHYTIPKTKHFIGVEINKEIKENSIEVKIHPQAKIKLNKKLAIGIISEFPIKSQQNGLTTYLRIMYEP